MGKDLGFSWVGLFSLLVRATAYLSHLFLRGTRMSCRVEGRGRVAVLGVGIEGAVCFCSIHDDLCVHSIA
jgi:hypothetical protein